VETWRATLVWGDDSGWSGVMIQAGGGLEGYAGLGVMIQAGGGLEGYAGLG